MATNQLSLRAAPIIHMGIMMGAIAILGAFWFIRGDAPMALAPEFRLGLGYLGYAFAAAILFVAVLIKNRIPTLERGMDLNQWWTANSLKAVAIWGMGEAACITGAVLWFLTDNQLVLMVLVGVGLLILALYRPSKLMEVS